MSEVAFAEKLVKSAESELNACNLIKLNKEKLYKMAKETSNPTSIESAKAELYVALDNRKLAETALQDRKNELKSLKYKSNEKRTNLTRLIKANADSAKKHFSLLEKDLVNARAKYENAIQDLDLMSSTLINWRCEPRKEYSINAITIVFTYNLTSDYIRVGVIGMRDFTRSELLQIFENYPYSDTKNAFTISELYDIACEISKHSAVEEHLHSSLYGLV